MGKIFRTNVFTGEREWADFEGGVEVIESGWTSEKEYSTAWTRPLVSVAMGCHPDQVNEFNADLRRLGVTGAFHRKNGDLELNDNASRNRVMKLRGLRDNDAGYSQHAGR